MNDGFLHRYFLNNSAAPMLKWIHYFDIYERHFRRFRGRNPVMLEIGVGHGGSLAMWNEYFGSGCTIVGIDINPECKRHETLNTKIYIGSQDDPVVINAILDQHGTIDIVLDDGSHIMEHMVNTFNLLYRNLSPDGVYMVEDTHTCYWPEYGGGIGNQSSFVEMAKRKVDELNAAHTKDAVAISEFTKFTECVVFYDSVVVFERRPQGRRQMPTTGPM